ncbi:asparagine synthase (glutamine-hydrolyzing) [Bacteriovoracales bacterium]|nr:asparagine synthase (glutamine-hydrolyzing) [Bacteriovoracales bacterium]
MCGISGVFYFKETRQKETLKNLLPKLTNRIHHRGPDDQGHAFFDRAAIGMKRLSIIDLKSGQQPLWDDQKQYAIVYNGEIYNYKAIKRKLENQGIKFQTSSDTEVVFKGFLKKGPSILDELEGMFAIAIYNSKDHELFLARDRFGKKPLYYYQDSEKLIFSSEVDSILKSIDKKLDIDGQSYWDFLTYRYIPGEQTIFKSIKKIPPAHFTFIKNQNIEIKKYWSIPKQEKDSPKRSIVQKNFGQLFGPAVTKRFVSSDVEVGVVLSGGLDSCAVLHEASKVKPIKSYHVFFDVGENYNELKYAQMMAQSVNSELKTVEISESQFIDEVEGLGKIIDEPLSDLSTIPFKKVCDLASQEVKVVLSGEGSDEILAGYGLHHFYKMVKVFEMLQHPLLKKLALSAGKTFFPKKNWDYLKVPLNSLAKEMNYNITFQMDQKNKLGLTPHGQNEFKDSVRFLEEIYKEHKDQDVLNQVLHVISRDWLIEDVLMKSDKISMSSSLEVRCPFLDHQLAEFLFKTPGKYKIGFQGKKLESKILLRRYCKGKLPHEIITRKKLGFPVPAYAFIGQYYKDYVFDKLNQQKAFYKNYFDSKKVLNLFDQALKESKNEETKLKHFLWTLVNFENWFEVKKDNITL